MMSKITVLPSQTLLDVAIQHCGHVEAWPEIVHLNGLPGLTAELTAGQQLKIPPVRHQRVTAIYEREGYQPATTPQDRLEGIDYWFTYQYIVQ